MEEAGDPPRSASRSTSTRKRSRPSDAAACGGLISALPDSIILHVLSFLDIKDVVKTSALSRRWYSLWTQTSAVSVDFGTRNCVVKGEFEFVELFLLMCTSPTIRKLHLLDLNYYDGLKGMVDRWIRFAVVRRVEDLRIGLEDGVVVDTYVLPRALLRCESLTRLRLEYCGFPSFLGTISWSSLKVLSVHRTKLVDEVINGVLEGSPLLESLTLEACYGMNCIRIFSKVMRELVIRRYCYLPDEYIDEEDENHRHKNFCLEISIPNLRSMRLLGRWKGKEVVLVKQVSSLVDVELNFSLEIDETNSDIIYGTMKGIIRKLRFVDKVVIGNEILMDLHNYKGNGDASLELKCRHLTITTSADRYSLGQIAKVLECAPNVETLVIDFTPEMHFEAIPLNKAPFCNKFKSWNRFTSRIRNIEIIGFPPHYGTEPMYWLARLPNKKKWLSLIKFLLRDAQVLEKMVINFSAKWSWGYPVLYLKEADDAWEVLQVATDILGYPRGSKAAKVVFNYPFK